MKETKLSQLKDWEWRMGRDTDWEWMGENREISISYLSSLLNDFINWIWTLPHVCASVCVCVAAWKNFSRSHSPLFSSFWLNFYDIYCEHWGICQQMFFVSDRTHIHKRIQHIDMRSLKHSKHTHTNTNTNSVAYSFTIILAHTHVRIFTIPNMLSLV